MRRRIPWQLAVGLAIIVGWVVAGLAAPLLTDVDPLRGRTFVQVGTRSIPGPFEPGTFGYPLGSDRQGRDLWTNILYGARATFGLVGVVLLIRLVVGVTLGALAGWFAGRWIDRAVSALIDAFAAFPTILFAILWIFAFDIRSGASAFAAALAITGWWGFGRATRSALVTLRGRPFLEAARSGGLSEFALFARHALPNLVPTLAVAAALEASAIVLVLGELGFLGYVVGGGTAIPLSDAGGLAFFFGTPEWGAILGQGRFEIFQAPWIILVPSAAFASAVLAFNLTGHGLRLLFERAPVALGRLLTWRLALALVAIAIAFRLAAPLIGPAAGFAELARGFDAERARAHVAYLADPARGGRYTGSAGYADAATYVADRFRDVGLEPIGDDGTYFQRFRMPIVELTAMPSFERLGPEPKRYVPRVDFSEGIGGRRGGGTAEGKVVFVGGAVRSPDYSDFKGTTPEGNIALIAGPGQPGTDPIDSAIRSGAVGVIFVRDPVIKLSAIPTFETRTVPVIYVSERVADELIAESGKRVADLRRELEERRRRQSRPSLRAVIPEPLSFDTNTRVRISVPLGPVRTVETMNVVGLLRGADPDRAQRIVLVGGHLDGIGTDPDGTVFPGANDNASGPAVMLETARVLAQHRALLKTSVVFAAFAGEEIGLVGSEQFANWSLITPWRPMNVISFFNLDVTGCCGPELGASEESYVLRARLAAGAERFGIDLGHVQGSSDHFTYLRRRVPAVMVAWTDLGAVHTTRDTVETIEPWRLRAAGLVTTQGILELAAGE